MSQGRHIASRPIVATTALCVALGLFAAACRHQEAAAPPPMLRVGVLPTDAPNILRERHGPLLDAIQHATGIPTELVIPADYDELLHRFHARTIEVAFFGGYTYVLAHDRDGAVPLVMRDEDLRFTSVFLVRPGSSAASLEDLQGARFSFGDKRSTSGHLMPRVFLSDRGIDPEQFFKDTLYSGGHDATAYRVRDGTADAGVASADVVRRMLRDGRLAATDVRILWETPEYPDYVWAVQPTLASDLVEHIQDHLLDLSQDDPDHRRILEAAGAGSFVPALDEEFDALRRVLSRLEQMGYAG